MCEVTAKCGRRGSFWIQTNLPATVANVREGELGIAPDRSVFACGNHLSRAVREIRTEAREALVRIAGRNAHTGWKGVTVKMKDGSVWR